MTILLTIVLLFVAAFCIGWLLAQLDAPKGPPPEHLVNRLWSSKSITKGP